VTTSHNTKKTGKTPLGTIERAGDPSMVSSEVADEELT
jgi:hypothetical protein